MKSDNKAMNVMSSPSRIFSPPNKLPSRPLSQDVFIDSELASLMLEYNSFKRQRRVSKDNINLLKRAMIEGKFIPECITFAVYIDEMGDLVCKVINGQHRLLAIVDAEVVGYDFTVRYVPFDSYESAALAYSSLDKNKGRSFADHLVATGMIDNIALISQIKSGLRNIAMHIKCEFKAGRSAYRGGAKDDIENGEIASEYLDAIEAYSDLCRSGSVNSRKIFARHSVAAVAIVTIKHFDDDEREATAFWSKAITGIGLRDGDPEKALFDKLYSIEGSDDTTNAIRARAAAIAWNAFVDKKFIRNIVVKDPKAQIEIKGTPFA